MPKHLDKQTATSFLRYFNFIGIFGYNSHTPARSFFNRNGIYFEIKIDVSHPTRALVANLNPELAGIPGESQFDLPFGIGVIAMEKSIGKRFRNADSKAEFLIAFQPKFFHDFSDNGI